MNYSSHYGITESQRKYIRHWVILLAICEVLMLIFNGLLFEIYLTIAVLFMGGFLLRAFRIYPGQDEPLILDFSAVVIALLFANIAVRLGASNWRFLQIFCSSAIIIPHFLFILKEK